MQGTKLEEFILAGEKMIKIVSALPKTIVYPDEIFEKCGSDVAFQKEKLGIIERRILAEDEKAIDLAIEACNNLFEKENIQKDEIDLLIYVTQNPEMLLPQNSSQVQEALGLNKSLCAFDVNLGCSGYVYALNIAKSLMLANNLQNALIITCDCYSKIIDISDKDTYSIFGDAATATYINNPNMIGSSNFYTNGAGAKHLCKKNNEALYMNGRAIFNFMMTELQPSLEDCLEKNQLTIEQIDYFIFHQASKFLLETLTSKLGLDKNKVPIWSQYTANTVSSTIPLVLEGLLKTNSLENKTLLLSGFGVGLSSSTTILHT